MRIAGLILDKQPSAVGDLVAEFNGAVEILSGRESPASSAVIWIGWGDRSLRGIRNNQVDNIEGFLIVIDITDVIGEITEFDLVISILVTRPERPQESINNRGIINGVNRDAEGFSDGK